MDIWTLSTHKKDTRGRHFVRKYYLHAFESNVIDHAELVWYNQFDKSGFVGVAIYETDRANNRILQADPGL